MKVGLREATRRFSKIIKTVRAGQEVILTERGKPIAVVKPITNEGRLDAVLKQMADEGLITLPTKTGPMPRFEPARITGKPISQTIIDGRRGR